MFLPPPLVSHSTQHLFEKYNPSSIILPVMATSGSAGAGAGAAPVADEKGAGGDAFAKPSFGTYFSATSFNRSTLDGGDQKLYKAAGGGAAGV